MKWYKIIIKNDSLHSANVENITQKVFSYINKGKIKVYGLPVEKSGRQLFIHTNIDEYLYWLMKQYSLEPLDCKPNVSEENVLASI